MSDSGALADPNFKRERSVFLALRVMDIDSPAVFLVKETKHNAWFIPGGKVEPGENDYVAMVRELKEETGLVIPNSCRMTRYRQFEQTNDSHEPVDVVLFVADVPYSYLFGEDAFLDRDHARDLGETLSAIRFANATEPDENPIPTAMASPIHAGFQVEVTDGYIRDPAWHCFSFGELAPLKDIQSRVEIDAFQPDSYKGFPFRFNMSESKLWGEVFSAIQNPKSAEELYRETVPIAAPAVSAHANHAVPAEFAKRQPRFDSIKGEGDLEKTLFPEINRIKNIINNPLNPSGMTGPQQVSYITEMFSGRLGTWWNKQVQNAFNDPSVIPTSIDALLTKIKTSFCVRDFEIEHLTKLFALKQVAGNAQGVQNYATEFNRYMDTWDSQMEWKLKAYWFILGLENADIRSDLFGKVKNGEFDKFPEGSRLAHLLNNAATCALNRSDGASGSGSKRPPDSDYNSGGGGSQNGKKKKKTNGNGNGNGKGGKQKQGKNANSKAEKDKVMSTQIYKDTVAKLKADMGKAEFDRHCKESLCLGCHNKGHMLWQCWKRPELRP